MPTANQVALEKGIRADFLRAVLSEPVLTGRIASVISSTARDEKYAWLGESPQMSDITDAPLVITPHSEASYTLENRTFAAAIGISRNDINDDQVGAFRMRIRDLVRQARRHINKLLMAALVAGTADAGYDGVSFFNAAHPARGADGVAFSNLLTGTGSTLAQVRTDLTSSIQALLSFLDEAGEPFHTDGATRQFAIVMPVQLEQVFMEAIVARTVPDSGSEIENVRFMKQSWDMIPSPRLTATSTNDWYLLHVGDEIRPLIVQDREALELSVMENQSDASFFSEKYFYKVRRRYAVGYAHPQNAIKINNA